MTVLIVDDSALMRRIVRQALEQAGVPPATMLEACNGAEGLAALERGAPDLVLCDVHMPVMDGIAFLHERAARGLAPETPVLMVTADAGDPLLHEAASVGAQGFISKPFSISQMRDCVMPLLGGAPSSR